MAERTLIRRPRDTPAHLRTTLGHARRLPEDLLRQASRRLEILALIGTALWILAPALGHLALYLATADPRWAHFQTIDAIATGSVVTSLALYLFLRTGDRDPHLVMDLALLYMVAVSFASGVLI